MTRELKCRAGRADKPGLRQVPTTGTSGRPEPSATIMLVRDDPAGGENPVIRHAMWPMPILSLSGLTHSIFRVQETTRFYLIRPSLDILAVNILRKLECSPIKLHFR